MSKANSRDKKPLLPTITSAIGMLLGGLLGAAVGPFSRSELVTIICYNLGFIGGAAVGAMVGWRMHARRSRGQEDSQ